MMKCAQMGIAMALLVAATPTMALNEVKVPTFGQVLAPLPNGNDARLAAAVERSHTFCLAVGEFADKQACLNGSRFAARVFYTLPDHCCPVDGVEKRV